MVIVAAREEVGVRATGGKQSVQWMQAFSFADGKMKMVREFVDGGADFGPED